MENMVEFSIDGELAAVILDSPMFPQGEVVTSPPYSISLLGGDVPKSQPTILELVRHNTTSPYRPKFSFDMGAGDVRFSHGSPRPPRTYRLYDFEADTLMTSGTYDSGVSHKSHPFPLAGYENIAVHFRADTAATDGLVIEILTQEGNWRTYDTITATANELETYAITNPAPLGRIGYNPDADGASITDAEVSMR